MDPHFGQKCTCRCKRCHDSKSVWDGKKLVRCRSC